MTSMSTEESQPPRKKLKREKRPNHALRYDGKKHLPAKENRNNATRCKMENCTKKSHTYCTKCDVHLCLEPNRNCYLLYHQLDIPE